MNNLSMHILDIVQNSISAKATLTEIRINEDIKNNVLNILIKDNGVGMNKLLMQQQNSSPLKILEINMDHELVQEIKASIINKNEKNTEENQRVKTLIDIIFYEACIIEGEKISDTKDFIKKINILLSKN